jgi:hypothetical protein
VNDLVRQNTEKEVHMNIRPQSDFEIQPVRSFELSPLDFCCVWALTNRTVLSCHFK